MLPYQEVLVLTPSFFLFFLSFVSIHIALVTQVTVMAPLHI